MTHQLHILKSQGCFCFNSNSPTRYHSMRNWIDDQECLGASACGTLCQKSGCDLMKEGDGGGIKKGQGMMQLSCS